MNLDNPMPKATHENQNLPSAPPLGSAFPRKPGPGWKHVAGSVWEHVTGLRIHTLGLARLPDGKDARWNWSDEYQACRQQGHNVKRALMVWALSQLPPNTELRHGEENL
jgi:hypothetical protein